MMLSLRALVLSLGLVLPVLSQTLPLHTSSRWILDANNQRVKLRCVNWAGHMEAMVPEGLNKQSIDFLADWIKNQGFNCVRLTYSIDHALNPDQKVSDAFAAAAGLSGTSGSAWTDMYNQALQKNPCVGNSTTRDVFGIVVDALWQRNVMTVLDNHVSKASWCCDLTDGNGWWDAAFGYNSWNSRFFNTQNWLNGLQAMATWAKGHPGVVAMSLRNELREFLLQDLNSRNDWYNYVGQAAKLVHSTHPDVLIVVGGVLSATDLTHVRSRMLDTSAWAGKHVWEFHAYSFTVTFTNPLDSCAVQKDLYGAFDGFVLEEGKPYTAPLFLSEFGVSMTGGSAAHQGVGDADYDYLVCLADYMHSNDAEWSHWALMGSYYARSGTVDYDEGFGLMNHDWSGLRNPNFPALLGPMWDVTQGP